MNFWFILLPFLIGAAACAVFLPMAVHVAQDRHLFDEINERKSHTVATPRIGGVIFVPTLLLALFVSSALLIPSIITATESVRYGFLKSIAFFGAGLMLIYIVGWLDDFKGVNYRYKFLAQIAAALLLIAGGLTVSDFDGLFGIHQLPEWAGAALTVFLTVGIINAYNLVDGIDGLCSTLGMLAVMVLDYCFIRKGMVFQTILASATIGVFFVFLILNVFTVRHKTFMGDTGSMIMGYIIAYLCICVYVINPYRMHVYSFDPLYLENPVALIIGIMFHPIFDMFRVFLTRALKHKPVFGADRLHFHHKLLDLGLSHRQATLTIAVIQCVYIAINWFLSALNVNLVVLIDMAVGTLIWLIVNYQLRKNR